VFRADAVVGVLDWERASGGSPPEEVIRAMHLSFLLEPGRSGAFLDGYRSDGTLTLAELDAAALSYGYRRDRSVWLMDELYRQGNERLRPLLNGGPFVPFEVSWAGLRDKL
jgi:aminoglycoside phosphotransferase (APT) family kinase protein